MGGGEESAQEEVQNEVVEYVPEDEIENVFSEGKYYFNVALERNEDKKLLFQQQELADFSVVGMDREKYNSFGETYVDFNIEVKWYEIN